MQSSNLRLEPVGEPALATRLPESEAASTDWRESLPTLTGHGVTLRELRLSDAPHLAATLGAEDIARFIPRPPSTVEGFERFILLTWYQRQAGRYFCYGIVPNGLSHAVGMFQVRQLDPHFGTAECGVVMGRDFWGSGVFLEGARLIADFLFETVGVHRLEARSTLENGRGNGAMAKMGAVREAVLRQSFFKDGRYMDQALWSIVRQDWLQSKAVWGEKRH